MDALFSASKWTLESDKQLFLALGQFSQSFVQRADTIVGKLDKLEDKCAETERNSLDASNQLQSLRNNQFIHTRVIDIPKSKESVPIQKNTTAKQQQLGVETSRSVLLHGEEVDPLNERPLPYIIGSEDFYSDPNIGLIIPDDFVEGRLEDHQEPHLQIQASSRADLPREDEVFHAQQVFGDQPSRVTRDDSSFKLKVTNSDNVFNSSGFLPVAESQATSFVADIGPTAVTIKARNSMEGDEDDIFSQPVVSPVPPEQVFGAPSSNGVSSQPPLAPRPLTQAVSSSAPSANAQTLPSTRAPPPPPPPRVTQNLLFDDVDDIFGDSAAPFSDAVPSAVARAASLFEDDHDRVISGANTTHQTQTKSQGIEQLSQNMQQNLVIDNQGSGLNNTGTQPGISTVSTALPSATLTSSTVNPPKKRGLFDDDEDEEDDGLIY